MILVLFNIIFFTFFGVIWNNLVGITFILIIKILFIWLITNSLFLFINQWRSNNDLLLYNVSVVFLHVIILFWLIYSSYYPIIKLYNNNLLIVPNPSIPHITLEVLSNSSTNSSVFKKRRLILPILNHELISHSYLSYFPKYSNSYSHIYRSCIYEFIKIKGLQNIDNINTGEIMSYINNTYTHLPKPSIYNLDQQVDQIISSIKS